MQGTQKRISAIFGALLLLALGAAAWAESPELTKLIAAHEFLSSTLAPLMNCFTSEFPPVVTGDPAYPNRMRDHLNRLGRCQSDAHGKSSGDGDVNRLKSRLDALIDKARQKGARFAELNESIDRLKQEQTSKPLQADAIGERLETLREEARKLEAELGELGREGATLNQEFRTLNARLNQRIKDQQAAK